MDIDPLVCISHIIALLEAGSSEERILIWEMWGQVHTEEYLALVYICMIVYAHAHGFSCPINRLNGSVFCFAVVSPRYTSGDEVNKQLYSTMAFSVTLEAFNPDVESVDDYKERFDFYCTANQVSRE